MSVDFQTMSILSHGRRGLLTRPVINWLVPAVSQIDTERLGILMSRADVLLALPYQVIYEHMALKFV